MTRDRKFQIALLLGIAAPLAMALTSFGSAAEIEGRWMTRKSDAIVLIEPKGGHLVGRIVWIRDEGSVKGAERLDSMNPDAALQTRKVVGIEMLTDLPVEPSGDGSYGIGRVYNPRSGQSYRVSVQLESPNVLKLRVGGPILGHTTRWTRVEGDVKVLNAARAPGAAVR